ncbi:CbaC protein [Natrialbaceae archaeon AArc-T1-2]|uniref:CbaC protein n=1 Tax=Natrialbaceae archaeon AArc-T1-2 TaxID=3053904 RepID=UPI00255B25C7|nr:CbaC protein [Natrialbaceae archaeon AArc-T1-2]WIV66615.1 CbaC protein [Natrialbaceae archaeon AArc-T1-2]
MRISRAALLIVIAFTVVAAVELRTLFELFGLEVSPVTTALITVVAIVAIVLWAVLTDLDAADSESDDDESGTDPESNAESVRTA